MTKEIKQLLIDCANFIQPYDDGGNEAERLMIRLDEALDIPVVVYCKCKVLSNLNDSIIGIDTCVKCDRPIDG